MLIPLHTFNTSAVLRGARVPVHNPLYPGAPAHRLEWVSDRMICLIRGHVSTVDEGSAWWIAAALDPTEPDTARLIGRRIAEAMSWPDLYAAQLISARVPRSEFGIAVLLADGFHCGAFATERFTAPLRGLPATTENLPEARRRLLCAPYFPC